MSQTSPMRQIPGWLKRPAHDLRQRLRHQSLPPGWPRERVAEAQAAWDRTPQVERAENPAVVAPGEDVGAGGGRCRAARDVGAGFLDPRVRPPRQEAGDFGVPGVAIEDRPSIRRGDGSEHEPGGSELVREHERNAGTGRPARHRARAPSDPRRPRQRGSAGKPPSAATPGLTRQVECVKREVRLRSSAG